LTQEIVQNKPRSQIQAWGFRSRDLHADLYA